MYQNEDIEILNNLIIQTNTINQLLMTNFEEFSKIIEILNKITDEKDYKAINNEDIKKAIKEILKSEEYLKYLKEDTNINIKNIS